jgi:hypothetical protein
MPVDFTNDLDAKIHASFFILMQACAELKNYDFTCFSDIREDVLRAAGGIDLSESLQAHRETAIQALKDLYTLKVYFNQTDEWTGFNLLHQKAAESEAVPLGGEMLFYEHLKAMVGNDENAELDTGALCDWISCIPLRMTAARYYDYIDDAAGFLPVAPNEANAENFKRVFYPLGFLSEAAWLREYKKPLDAVWEAEAAVDGNAAQLKVVNAQLIKLTAYVCTLFDALCAAIIAGKAHQTGTALLSGPKVKTLYSEFAAFMAQTGEDKDFHARLDQATSEAMEKIIYDSPEGIKADGLNAEELAAYNEWLPVHKLFYGTGFDYFNFMVEPDDESEANVPAFTGALKKHIEAVTKDMPGKRKRFLRQYFLRFLPYPYELEDYKKYFIETCDGLDDVNRRLLSFMVLSESRRDAE